MPYFHRYLLCKSCLHTKINRQMGLYCGSTKRKPCFAFFCNDFAVSKTRDSQIIREHEKRLDINPQLYYWILVVIFSFIIFGDSAVWIPMVIIAGIIIYYIYVQYTKEEEERIKDSIGELAYSFVILSAEIFNTHKNNLNSTRKILYQTLIIEYGYEIADKGLRLFDLNLNSKKKNFEIYTNLKSNYDSKTRLNIFYALFEFAVNFYPFQLPEDHVIVKMAQYIGLTTRQFDYIKTKFYKQTANEKNEETTNNNNNRQYNIYEPKNNLTTYYKMLELTDKASDKEIKSAFRRLAMKYHPDRQLNKNEKEQKSLSEKFQEILQAYEAIKTERGIR